MRKLNLAQEENLEPDDPNAIHEANQAIAEADSGVAEAQLQITEIGAAIDSAEDAKQTVEVAADGMEATLDNGGMDENGVKVLQQSLEHMLSRLGYQSATMRYAHESFSAKKDNIAATKLAVEDLRETAKKIWEKIKAAFRKLIEWIKKLFNSKEKKFEAISKKASAVSASIKAEEKEHGSKSEPDQNTAVKIEYPAVFTNAHGQPLNEAGIRSLIEFGAMESGIAADMLREDFDDLTKYIKAGIRALNEDRPDVLEAFGDHVYNFYRKAVEFQAKRADSHKDTVIDGIRMIEFISFENTAYPAIALLPHPDNFKQLDISAEGGMSRLLNEMSEMFNNTSYKRQGGAKEKVLGDRLSLELRKAMVEAVERNADSEREAFKRRDQTFAQVEQTIDQLENRAVETGYNDHVFLSVATMLRVLMRWVTQLSNYNSQLTEELLEGFLYMAKH